MSVTSANVNDLAAFATGSQTRVDRLTSTLSTTVTKANTVMPLCSGSQYPSTPSLSALNDLLGTWLTNQGFVATIHDELVLADQFDGNGMATVSDTAIDAALQAKGLEEAPDLVDVDAVELYGQPPYSGFVDDPICLANGNLLLRDGDVQLFGVAAALSVVRTYNSRDRRAGVFGTGWSSLLDVALAIEERRVTFRGPDGAGATFHARQDGTWVGGGRRRLSLTGTVAGWEVADGHERTWRFDAEGTLQGFTAGGADVVIERGPDTVRCTDRTSGRSVTYRLEGPGGLVTSAVTSDGRTAAYDYDPVGRLVGVHRDRGHVTYELDDRGFLAGVVDADGIVVCRNRFDAVGRVLSQVENHGRETSYQYRSDGVSTVTASDGAPPNVMVHDRRGRLTAMIDGLGNAMRVAYDDHDDIVQIVERTGAVTRFSYDDRGNPLQRVDPDGLSETFTWDDADRLVARTDRAGGTTRYVYEGRRVPVRVVQPDGSEVHATYDDRDLVTSVVDADGVSARIEWDRDGLVAAVTDGLGARVAFEYDAAGRSLGLEAPDGVAASVDLDGAGRVLALRTADGEQLFDYSAAGRMLGGRRATGAAWQATRDEAGDVAGLARRAGPPGGLRAGYGRPGRGLRRPRRWVGPLGVRPGGPARRHHRPGGAPHRDRLRPRGPPGAGHRSERAQLVPRPRRPRPDRHVRPARRRDDDPQLPPQRRAGHAHRSGRQPVELRGRRDGSRRRLHRPARRHHHLPLHARRAPGRGPQPARAHAASAPTTRPAGWPASSSPTAPRWCSSAGPTAQSAGSSVTACPRRSTTTSQAGARPSPGRGAACGPSGPRARSPGWPAAARRPPSSTTRVDCCDGSSTRPAWSPTSPTTRPDGSSPTRRPGRPCPSTGTAPAA